MIDNILKLLTPKNSIIFVTSNMTIRQGIEKFRAHGYTALPVLNEDGTYFGVLTEGDFLWNIIDNNYTDVKELEDTTVDKIIRKKVPSCSVSVSYDELKEIITNNNFVPIVDDRNIFMGIITRKSVINFLKS